MISIGMCHVMCLTVINDPFQWFIGHILKFKHTRRSIECHWLFQHLPKINDQFGLAKRLRNLHKS